MTPRRVTAPLSEEARRSLAVGEEVLLSGVILTARDAAHERLVAMIKSGRGIPPSFRNAVVYYCGPTPPRPGMVIGSCGPTTSSRMDEFTPALLDAGVTGMIGKGNRSPEVRAAVKRHRAVYFLATGGIGALLARQVKRSQAILFNDLGPEAVYRLEIEDFPLIVGIDAQGRDIYR